MNLVTTKGLVGSCPAYSSSYYEGPRTQEKMRCQWGRGVRTLGHEEYEEMGKEMVRQQP